MTKKVNLVGTVLFTVCSIIALDSFVAPSMIGVPAITLWAIAATVFFFPYGLISSELGASYPDDGGITSWVTRAFGEKHGVMVGWMYWINVAFWMPAVFTAFSGWLSLVFFPEMPLWVQGLIAVIMCWIIVWIGVRGIDVSVKVSSLMAVVKVSVLILFGAAGILYATKYGTANEFSAGAFIPKADDALKYTAVIVYNLMGFELIGSVGSKIEDARRTVPKMIVIAGIMITVLYAFGTFGVLTALPAEQIDEVDGFIHACRELFKVFGSAGTPLFYTVSVASIISLVSNMITWSMGGNEAFMGAKLDQRSAFFGHRHPTRGTADHLYYAMGVIATFLIVMNYLLSGNANEIFWTLFSFSSLVFMMCYLYMFAAFIKLKYSDHSERAYEVPGGKAGAWIAFVLCFAGTLLACYFLIDWDISGYGFRMEAGGTLLTILSGYALYRAGRKK